MTVRGNWEGKLIDATGATAMVTLNLKDNRGRLSGDFSLYFVSDDGRGDGRRLAQSGEVSGTRSASRSTVRLSYRLSLGGKKLEVKLDGKQVDPGNHAKKCIIGCYESSGDEALTLRGGGVVLWQYAGK